jgi:predicted nucleic acid-binding protein
VAGSRGLYLDTSAVLRATLETGSTPDLEDLIGRADVLITSRLTLVEAARAVQRVRRTSAVPEERLADLEHSLDSLWGRCVIWEISRQVCDLAGQVAPHAALRTLAALHVATFLLARRRIGDVELVTTDDRMRAAVGGSPGGGAAER